MQTKLFRPRLRPSLISRPRLIKKLNAGLDGKFTLVSAPPGFGKTTLVSEWLSQTSDNIGVAWYSLEESDNDPNQFFAYLIGTFQAVEPGIGQALARAAPLPPPESAVAMLINDLAASSRSIALVLDDFHVITTAAIHQAIVFLVDHMPSQLHLVTVSRSDPPFSLSRLRVRGELNEVRARDLRFTMAEASDFLHQTMGLDLSADEVAVLDSRTEGWVAGLQLAAHSLQQEENKEAFLSAFAGDDRYIADYLLEEVLAHQPAEIQKFLLQTSVLNRLSGPLCDALLDRKDSQSILELLEGSNLFIVPLDNRRQWYRYHQLFADLLRERLEATPGEIVILHEKASQWYEENDFALQAVEHALSAADYDRAVGLILLCAPEMFSSSRLSTLQRWWQQVPDEMRAKYPGFCLMAAWAWLSTGDGEESERCLQIVEGALANTTEVLLTDIKSLEAETRNGLIEVASIRVSGQTLSQADARETLHFCEHILPYLAEKDQPHLFNPPISLRPVVLFNMGLAYQTLGQTHEAVAAQEESVELGKALGNVHIVAPALGHLAEARITLGELHRAAETCRDGIDVVTALAGKITPLAGLLQVLLGQLSYEWNELENARRHLQEGIRAAKPWRHRETLLAGYLALARVHQALGQYQDALKAQEAFDELTGEIVVSNDRQARVHQAWLHAQLGDVELANHWKESPAELNWEAIQEAEAIVLVRIQLLAGSFVAAGQCLGAVLESAESGGRWGRVVELLALQAVAFEGQGEREAALESLNRALEMAEPEGYVRTFVDGGQLVAGLLREAAENGRANEYAIKILDAFQVKEIDGEGSETIARPGATSPGVDAGSNADAFELVESLSDRELEVLQLIAEGMSNKEIAARLYLAPGTVKVHAHNIYGKLGVGGRTQAIAKARELNLLPWI